MKLKEYFKSIYRAPELLPEIMYTLSYMYRNSPNDILPIGSYPYIQLNALGYRCIIII